MPGRELVQQRLKRLRISQRFAKGDINGEETVGAQEHTEVSLAIDEMKQQDLK